MLVILAHAHDAPARSLADRWRAHGGDAGVLTCADLSVAGWRHEAAAPRAGRAVIAGALVPTHEIQAVITRVAGISDQELHWIHPADRAYAAAEMEAFLLAWLAALPCAVVNRPTAECLAGPMRSAEQWAAIARRLGIPTRPRRRGVSFASSATQAVIDETTVTVHVAGRRSFIDGQPADDLPVGRMALTLAREANTAMLRATFAREPDARFVGAAPVIDVADPAIADALLDHCMGMPVLRHVETRVALA